MTIGPALEQTIISQAIRNRDPIPDRILNAPQLMPGLEFEFEAFLDLDTERNHAFGLTQIPVSLIRSYGENHGLVGEGLEEFILTLRRVDMAHLSRLEQKKPKPQENGKVNASKPGE